MTSTTRPALPGPFGYVLDSLPNGGLAFQREPLTELQQLTHSTAAVCRMEHIPAHADAVAEWVAAPLREEVERLRSENFALAAGQCVHAIADEGGVLMCKQVIAQAARIAKLERVLQCLVAVIDAAGLHNLSNGVQLGPTVWYVKAHDAMTAARAALQPTTKEG